MNETNSSAVSENPFCTRRVRPGAIPFVFPPGQNAETLVDRLRQFGWQAEITGAHGSGKSALLAALIPALERAGLPVALVELHDGERRLPPGLLRDFRLRPSAVLIVDGYEQLSRWSRWLLNRFCRRHAVGLLVTAHEPVGLPRLFQTAATLPLAERIVGHLMGGQERPFTTEEVADCFSRRRGDLRETLFDLYDLFEQRRASPGQNVT